MLFFPPDYIQIKEKSSLANTGIESNGVSTVTNCHHTKDFFIITGIKPCCDLVYIAFFRIKFTTVYLKST